MTKVFSLTSFTLLLALGSCSKPPQAKIVSAETSATPQEPFHQIDACSLVTNAEIEAVQGEAVTGTTASSGTLSGFPSAQCVFMTTTPVNSVSVVITQTGMSSGRSVRNFWKKTFHREEGSEKEDEDTRNEKEEEEGEKKSPPQPVADLGDDAFWMGTQVSTALYVLKGDSYIRISVGGAGDQAAKLEKSRQLAGSILKRL